MAIASNIEQFKQSFREEAREILVELETTLLELHEHPTNGELVGKAFRGLHTIKGSGAMFGFEELAAFTHKLENAFDAVRNGELTITPPLVDLTLAALDQIRLLVEEESNPGHADGDRRAGILASVASLVGSGKDQGLDSSSLLAKAAGTTSANGTSSERSALRNWSIRFAPGPELLRDGTNPFLLIDELRQLGTLEIKADLTGLPPLAELDPERCYVNWEMALRTASGMESIRDTFIFVEDSCDLNIELQEDSSIEASDLSAREKAFEEQRTGPPGRRPYDKPDSA